MKPRKHIELESAILRWIREEPREFSELLHLRHLADASIAGWQGYTRQGRAVGTVLQRLRKSGQIYHHPKYGWCIGHFNRNLGRELYNVVHDKEEKGYFDSLHSGDVEKWNEYARVFLNRINHTY